MALFRGITINLFKSVATATALVNSTMAVVSVVGAVVVLLTVSSFASGLCPSGYQPASPDKCFKAFPMSNNYYYEYFQDYCAAQGVCAEYNGRLVEGAEWLRILSNASSAPRQIAL